MYFFVYQLIIHTFDTVKNRFYTNIAFLAVLLILSVSAVFIGSVILSTGKPEEATIGISCLITGIPLIIFSVFKMVRLNKNFKKEFLEELKNNPAKILFRFSDTKNGKSVIIGSEVLFIDNSHFPYKDFYILLEDVHLKENELHFSFRKTVRATQRNYSTDLTIIVNPPAELLLPDIGKWTAEFNL